MGIEAVAVVVALAVALAVAAASACVARRLNGVHLTSQHKTSIQGYFRGNNHETSSTLPIRSIVM